MVDDHSRDEPLNRLSVFYYGIGHMLNDITSACWFTYLLIFLSDIGLSPSDAAIVMLSGQVADAFTTVLAGELIDRFGHFKIWHAAGCFLVAISFSSVFGGCLPCKIVGSSSSTLETVGYSTFAAIFNVGWAATQVSHMSMVNCITLNSTSRIVLTSCRNACTMVANLSLYAVAFFVFKVKTIGNPPCVENQGTPLDVENQYRWIAYISIAIGCFFVAIFHFGTKEPRLNQDVGSTTSVRISWTYWFKKILYYQVALVYVLTRLVTNVSQAFLAFYLINDLLMPQTSKALVPAIIYICSFIVSVLLQEVAWTGQRVKAFYSAGGLLWLLCGPVIFFLPRSLNPLIYLLAVVIGIANALMMVTGISMQSFLVGEDVHGCAFVYGSLSFLDKIFCGIALCILEAYQNSASELQFCSPADSCFSISRYGLGFVPAICALGGVVVTCSLKLQCHSLRHLKEPLLA
ncbi:OLC1v1001709C1 [Oldenlandia corymbosa var. corymbosa]|uniref:OLC1v1001709C1 n=1 Tax=Oldenlandia corymbosa var. corymbosa TaxID=529605 RepID=A0AAV1D8Q0_OLDCO|nr:OLC1v1001709C1 [Oldenlandia corymbosa var. corymbosa]